MTDLKLLEMVNDVYSRMNKKKPYASLIELANLAEKKLTMNPFQQDVQDENERLGKQISRLKAEHSEYIEKVKADKLRMTEELDNLKAENDMLKNSMCIPCKRRVIDER